MRSKSWNGEGRRGCYPTEGGSPQYDYFIFIHFVFPPALVYTQHITGEGQVGRRGGGRDGGGGRVGGR